MNRDENDLYGIFFPLGSTKISDYANGPKPRFAKIFFKNTEFGAKYLFRVKSYHTSAEELSIS